MKPGKVQLSALGMERETVEFCAKVEPNKVTRVMSVVSIVFIVYGC